MNGGRLPLALPALALLWACRPSGCGGPAFPELQGVEVEPASAHVAAGERLHLEAEGLYADGSVRDVTGGARWRTSGAAAVVVAGGELVTREPGTVTVEATWEGRTGRAVVGVEAHAPVAWALELHPTSAELEVGGAVTFSASERLLDGTTRDVTDEVTWASSRPEVGKLLGGRVAPGMVLGSAPGETEVTARQGGLVAAAEVLVARGKAGRPVFPVAVAPGGRFLVDARGAPVRIQGEAAWSLIANLTAAEVDTYLDDRRRRGFNTLIVNLIEHRYAQNAPRNRRGDAPFRTPGELSQPNDAYFDFAASVLAKARERGFLVLLVPAYLGYGCPPKAAPENEGWSAEMGRSSREACLAYGRYVGRRFGRMDNLVWVAGGDCLPQGPLETCSLAVHQGIRESGSERLWTGHWSPNTLSIDEPAFAPAMQLDAVYQYRTPYPACRRAWAREPPLPAFLVESGYENEKVQDSSPPSRKYLFWASLACTAGVVSGNRPIWLFDKGWPAALDSSGTHDMELLGRLFETLPWTELVPSGLGGMRELVTAGRGLPGTADEVAAAATPDGRALVAYLPPTGREPRRVVVDLTVLPGPATARWLNPATGGWVPIGQVPNSGPRWFTTPGDNGSGLNDWMLVVTRPGSPAR